MAEAKESTVQNNAPQKVDISKEVSLYLASISVFFDAYKKGEITQKEMLKIEEKLVRKTGINPLSVYRIKDLIIEPTRANIVVGEKEVISNEINKVRKIAKTG